jgi:hypothetical protein
MCDKALSSMTEEETEEMLKLVIKLTRDIWEKIALQNKEE